jgi:hypothetical protein
MIPPEDLPPQWIRDYDSLYNVGGDSGTGAGGGPGIEVNTPAMNEFAAALRSNVDDEYNPHARVVFDDMTTPVPVSGGFTEMQWALTQHRDIQLAATDNVANQGNGARIFAHAASEIASRYQDADAYSAARLEDVHHHLGTTPAPPASTNPTTTNPTTNPAGGA